MAHEFALEGVALKTGDIICTRDGDEKSPLGRFWLAVGRLIPGEVDHVAIYVGPGGRCVEAGAKGRVVEFTLPGPEWNARKMKKERGEIIDVFVGAVSPLSRLGLAPAEEEARRAKIAAYCLKKVGKPYNLNFLNSATERAFYCSQLAYKAYGLVGVNLNTNRGIPQIPGSESIIFPTEIWEGWR